MQITKLSGQELRSYSLTRAISRLTKDTPMNDRNDSGLELLAEKSLEADGMVRKLNNSILIPFEVLNRSLSTSVASQGGYLTPTHVGNLVETLRPVSIVANTNAQIVSGLSGDLILPRETGNSTGYWLPTETTQITESSPSYGAISCTPKTAGAFVRYSRQLKLQGAGLESYLQNNLLKTLGSLIDASAIAGSGATGEPLGLLNVAGTLAQSGTSLSWTGITSMQKTVADNNGEVSAFIGTPTVRKVLQDREKSTGSGFIWSDDRVSNKPAFASTAIPTGILIGGDFQNLVMLVWGGGFELALNPFEDFKSGFYSLRMMVDIDIVVQQPQTFSIATGVS